MLNRVKHSISNLIYGNAAAGAKAWSEYEHNIFHELHKRATAEAADYLAKLNPHPVYLRDYDTLFGYVMERIDQGQVIELGVSRGKTINIIAGLTDRTVHGFDSFEGLPEDWGGWRAPTGHFSQGGKLPKVRDNVVLHKGWFSDTLEPFAKENKQPLAFLHVHCDLYSSASHGLDVFKRQIVPDTIIVFHEYFGYHGWRDNEFKAWQEFVERHKVKYDYLAYASGAAGQMVIQVNEINVK